MKRESVLNKKKSLLVVLFVMLIVGISFGYASLQTTLKIEGNARISRVGWLVHFKNLNVTNGSFGNPNDQNQDQNYVTFGDNYGEEDDTSIEFDVTLSEPGQFYEFSFDIANDGNLDATLESIDDSQCDDTDGLPYLTYSIQTLPSQGSTLEPGSENYVHVVVRFEFPSDIEPSQLPDQDHSFHKKYVLNYVQAQ